MGVLLYGVTNIEWFAGFDMFEMLTHIKCDSIHDIFRFAIYQFQFHVFVLFSNKAACSVIGYTPGAENRFWFPGPNGLNCFSIVKKSGVISLKLISVSMSICGSIWSGKMCRATCSSNRAVNSLMCSSFIDNPTA